MGRWRGEGKSYGRWRGKGWKNPWEIWRVKGDEEVRGRWKGERWEREREKERVKKRVTWHGRLWVKRLWCGVVWRRIFFFFFSLSFEFGININKNMLIILFYFGTKILLFHSTRVLSTYSQFIHMLYWIHFKDSAWYDSMILQFKHNSLSNNWSDLHMLWFVNHDMFKSIYILN